MKANPFPAVAVTQGPQHHFFGYYEICPWNATDEFHLCLEVDFHDRPPVKGDKAGVGIIEMATGRFERLAETEAWNLQQGAMLHWLPSAADRVIAYNARQGDRFVAVKQDIHSGRKQILPRPISGLSHSGRYAASLNYARLKAMRPVVGYAGLPDPFRGIRHPEDDGLFVMDTESGETHLAVSYAEIRDFLRDYPDVEAHGLWFNHTAFNRDDTRILAVVRYNEPGVEIKRTLLFSVAAEGGDLRLLAPMGASHFTWRTERQVFGWLTYPPGSWYYFVDEVSGEASPPYRPDILFRNGHCSFTRDGQWLLTDSYPRDRNQQELLLWNMADERLIRLGRFAAPLPFRGEIRCDLHPRFNRAQNTVSFDSIHEGTRQIYNVDISSAINGQAVCPSLMPSNHFAKSKIG